MQKYIIRFGLGGVKTIEAWSVHVSRCGALKFRDSAGRLIYALNQDRWISAEIDQVETKEKE